MNSTHLNEHDANQGAQSSGEFLGMTGNSGWYLLGSGGATIMMVIFLWGILGVSLLLCLFIGIILCLGSVAYVFTLKNNKPEHYDTDFFESALVEAGVLQFCFGPRDRRLANPFTDAAIGAEAAPVVSRRAKSSARGSVAGHRGRSSAARQQAAATEMPEENEKAKTASAKPEPVVTQRDYDQLHEKLTTTEEMLEDALADASEHCQ
jgi:hypothetical protein